ALSDTPLRMWLNERLLVNKEQAIRVEYGTAMALRAGEKYDLRVETVNLTGAGLVQVSWSSPSVTRSVIPTDHLFPSKITGSRYAASDGGKGQPLGVVLRNGAFLAGAVERATLSIVKMTGRFAAAPISTVNVAQIICQPLAPAMKQRLQ